MAADYDASRKNKGEIARDSIEEPKFRRSGAGPAEIEKDENETTENFEFPGTDLPKEELATYVVPRQEDEFTCSQCLLMHHALRLDHVDANGVPVCTECAM